MSFVLVYSERGHELSTEPLESLSAINERIHHLHNTSHVGITVLRVEEHHDGPRTWQIEYPPAPPAWTRVRVEDGDWAGRVFTVSAARYLVDDEGVTWSWDAALNKFGPLTEVVETEVEAAARRLRERGHMWNSGPRATSEALVDMRTVLNHVLSGGTL